MHKIKFYTKKGKIAANSIFMLFSDEKNRGEKFKYPGSLFKITFSMTNKDFSINFDKADLAYKEIYIKSAIIEIKKIVKMNEEALDIAKKKTDGFFIDFGPINSCFDEQKHNTLSADGCLAADIRISHLCRKKYFPMRNAYTKNLMLNFAKPYLKSLIDSFRSLKLQNWDFVQDYGNTTKWSRGVDAEYSSTYGTCKRYVSLVEIHETYYEFDKYRVVFNYNFLYYISENTSQVNNLIEKFSNKTFSSLEEAKNTVDVILRKINKLFPIA